MSNEMKALRSEEIKNVVLFVGDAVRYDSISHRISSYGPTYKTIAASLHTPASFASMLTGLNVPEHGVKGFSNILPDTITSVVDLKDWNTYFSAKTGTMHDDMHRIFKMEKRAQLMDAEEPFIWVVRDPGGHAPYNGYDPETYDQKSETGPEYLNRVAGHAQQIKSDYNAAVKSSLNRFEEVIDCIRERGIEDETLLVYTSDHGEFLGEYGILGHNHVAAPELVYVPTTFVHPSLDYGEQDMTIRHIDLFPTIADILNVEKPNENEMSGHPIWSNRKSIGYNHFEMVFYNSGLLNGIATEVRSCWDGNGGHVFVESSYKDALLLYLGLMVKSHKGVQIRKDNAYFTALQQLLPGHKIYGEPEFDQDLAKRNIKDILHRATLSQEEVLNDDTKERLNDLGYL